MPVERIILVGAGNHGRGVLEILRRLREGGREIEFAGVIDDAPGTEALDGVPVLGTTAWLAQHLKGLGASVILAMAAPAPKKRIAEMLEGVGVHWAQAVHPRADLAPSVEVGPGTIIGSGVVVVYETRIGAHVTVNLNATVGHHVRIGDYTSIAPGANILGKVVIGEGCLINANSVILPSVTIGAGCTVGAGAVVLQDVPAGTTVFGNPARIMPVFKGR
jgi:sugar O-acyltransferase (sialic acid O-acetyltransferase NeuD family)